MGMAIPAGRTDYINVSKCVSNNTFDIDDDRHFERFREFVELLIRHYDNCDFITGYTMGEHIQKAWLVELLGEIGDANSSRMCGYDYYIYAPTTEMKQAIEAHEMRWTLQL